MSNLHESLEKVTSNQEDYVNIETKPTDWFQVIEQAIYNPDKPESTKYEILIYALQFDLSGLI